MTRARQGATLGVLGGGQLGLFFLRAAKQLGYRTAVLDPDPAAPAHREGDLSIVASYDDQAALGLLGRRCAGVTVELEAVPAASLRRLARSCFVSPSAEALAIAQDRLRSKRMLRAIGLATAPFAEVLAAGDAVPAELFPGILKTACNGYDGKGQLRVDRASDLAAAWRALGRVPCVLERRIAWDTELSMILARGRDGSIRTFPAVENFHRDGILELTRAPAEVPPAIAAEAAAAAALIAESLDHVGILAVEFFLRGRELLVNEFALRPHNSGHYTIDACASSQFEQQVRTLAGLPLGATSLYVSAAMLNVLGDAWQAGEPPLDALAFAFGARLHVYGKSEARAGRKMAHFTVLDARASRAARRAEQLREVLHGRQAEQKVAQERGQAIPTRTPAWNFTP